MAKSFLPTIFEHPYEIDPKYGKSVAYFSMEYAIDNSFKIYSGGLGYLSGSHMRSAHDLRQNLVGVGILWSYGYYNQIRAEDGSMATCVKTTRSWKITTSNSSFMSAERPSG